MLKSLYEDFKYLLLILLAITVWTHIFVGIGLVIEITYMNEWLEIFTGSIEFHKLGALVGLIIGITKAVFPGIGK